MRFRRKPEHFHLWLAWLSLAAVLAAFAAILAANAPRFDWDLPVSQMPAATLALGMSAAGLVFLTVVPLVRASLGLPATTRRSILVLILIVGCALRLSLFFTEPALEDDHNRYLWEGALVANGLSPYAVSPERARGAVPDSRLGTLVRESGPIVDRVNHPNLTSTYPPVAQAAFALAHVISPWNLSAWRAVSLVFDCAAGLLLIALLRQAGRSELWSALYWWNPIVIKELINSAHMEGVLMALVLAALLLLARKRHLGAALVLGLAIGTKIWPVLFVPLFLRPLRLRALPLLAAASALVLMCTLWLLPVYWAGFDAMSGFAAYARQWTTNSALFPLLEAGGARLLTLLGRPVEAAVLARMGIAVVLGAIALHQAWRPLADAEDLMRRAGLIAAALVLLSPAQFPWYMIWMLPFLAFRPLWGLLAVNVTVPLYYLSFHYMARGAYPVFSQYILWVMWVPVWALLALDIHAAVRLTRGNGANRVRADVDIAGAPPPRPQGSPDR
ncbi:MAG: DUF2029 domain-containing protein [Hyphomicrobiaceae bacterium]|nr:MAG: DUF2029 domain-containing protein [Hyphomicrobiaceae bacterium]